MRNEFCGRGRIAARTETATATRPAGPGGNFPLVGATVTGPTLTGPTLTGPEVTA